MKRRLLALLALVGCAVLAAAAGSQAGSGVSRAKAKTPAELIRSSIKGEEQAVRVLQSGEVLTLENVRRAGTLLGDAEADLRSAYKMLTKRARTETGIALRSDNEALDQLDDADEHYWWDGWYGIEDALWHKYRALDALGFPTLLAFTVTLGTWWDHVSPGAYSNLCWQIITNPVVRYGYGMASLSMIENRRGPAGRVAAEPQKFVLDKNGKATLQFKITSFGDYKVGVTVYSKGKKVSSSGMTDVTSEAGAKSCR